MAIPDVHWIFVTATEAAFSMLAGLIIEHHFSLLQKTLRIYYKYIRNEQASLTLTTYITTNASFKDICDALEQYLTLTGTLTRVRRRSRYIAEFSLERFSLTITRHSPGTYALDTDRIRAGVRDLRDDTRAIKSILLDLATHPSIHSITNTCVTITLPFKWHYALFLPPKQYELTHYAVEYHNTQHRSTIHVSAEHVLINNIDIANITDVLDDILRIL